MKHTDEEYHITVRIVQIIFISNCHLSASRKERENKLLELSTSNIPLKGDTLSNNTFQFKVSEKSVKKNYQYKKKN